jgi:AcrR family transcriptional regulator
VARRAPEGRLQQLVEAATAVFIAQGYRRTQMADVAAAMGVAKGTLYLYVDSKEALFDLALQHADSPEPLALPATLPVRAPSSGRTVRYVSERLAADPPSAALQRALRSGPSGHPAREVETILRELYRTMDRNRTGIKLVDRCAADYPELAEIWFTAGRAGLLAQLAQYLEIGTREGWLHAVPDVGAAARLVLETLVFWAVHRHWDPAPQPLDPSAAEATVVQILARALLADPREQRPPRPSAPDPAAERPPAWARRR